MERARSCPRFRSFAVLLAVAVLCCRSLGVGFTLRPRCLAQPARRGQLTAAAAAVEVPAVAAALPTWQESAASLVEGVEDCSDEDAQAWLLAGCAWTRSSKRFWRKAKNEAEPDPQAIKDTLAWLREKGLSTRKFISKFPEVIGLSLEELDSCKSTAPKYLQSDEAFLKAIRANPQLLGKSYDCLAEHDCCQGFCSRCWNT